MDEDVKRAAVAASGSNTDVPSNSKSTRHHQLSKFQELQRRRLQLISKPKNKKFKAKGAKPKLQNEELGTKGFPDDNFDQGITVTNSNSHGTESNEVSSSSPQVNIHPAFQKKKLHWGLDSKERWERKANM